MAQSELSHPTTDAVKAATGNNAADTGSSKNPDLFHEVMHDASEFGKAFFHSAVENPVNSVGQIVSFGHLPELHILEPDANATGAAKWAQMAGSVAGTLVDCVILSEVAAVAVAGLAGEAAVVGGTAAVEAAGLGFGERLAATGIAGFATGALLTPLKPGESGWHRLTNGVTSAASFMTFDGVASGLASQFANPTFLNTVFRSGVAGGLAGTVNANVKSLTEGHGLATVEQTLSQAESWAAGGAIMGGASYLLAKGWEAITAKSDNSGEAAQATILADRSARLADGREVKVAVTEGSDGLSQVQQVQMPDGTILTRQAAGNSWKALAPGEASGSATPSTANTTEWIGDVKVNPDGQLSFLYKFEKAPSNVSLEARLPDGSKVALAGPDGSLSLPGNRIGALSDRLPDTAAQSAKALNLDIAADRVRLDNVTTNGGVSSNYVVDLSAEEAAKVRALALQNTSIKIVPSEQAIGPVQSATAHIGENMPGSFHYDQPMADHTATMAVFKESPDGTWKVLTGLRDNAPFKDHEALPGGFLDLSGASVETPAHAATRELAEETGVILDNPKLVGVADELGRDSRNRVIDFGFGAVVPKNDASKLLDDSDLKGLKWQDLNELLADPKRLAFDHYRLLTQAYEQLIKGKPAP